MSQCREEQEQLKIPKEFEVCPNHLGPFLWDLHRHPIRKSGNVTGVMGISNPEISNNLMRLPEKTLLLLAAPGIGKKIFQDKRMAGFGNVSAGT